MVARACIMVDFAFCWLEFRVRACCNKTQILASKAFVDTGITEPDFQQGRTSSSTARRSLLLWLLLPSRTGTDVSLVCLRLILPCPADELRGPLAIFPSCSSPEGHRVLDAASAAAKAFGWLESHDMLTLLESDPHSLLQEDALSSRSESSPDFSAASKTLNSSLKPFSRGLASGSISRWEACHRPEEHDSRLSRV